MTEYDPWCDEAYEWISRDLIPDWLVAEVHQAASKPTDPIGDTYKIAAPIRRDWITGEDLVFCLEFVKERGGGTFVRRGRRLRPGENL